jgi:hypothetical protein
MSEEKHDTESTGFAARMKKILGGYGGGCCCSDVRIVSREPEDENDRE